MLISSCDPACRGVDCNTGICVEGRCVCPKGLEGEFCETRQTTKFTGIYNVVETCNTGDYQYSVTIRESDSIVPGLEIENFYDLEQSGVTQKVLAEVDFIGNSFEIPQQNIAGFSVEGNGVINDTTGIITISYKVNQGSLDVCTATLTK